MVGIRLTNFKATAYAAPVLVTSMLHAPALAVLPALYAKHTSIGLASLGLMLMIVRLIDVVTDPIIGYYSDRTNTRFGRRKPWIILGVALATVGAFFWMRPHAGAGLLWFFLSSVIVSLGWTLMEIPHAAWMADISHKYSERTRLSAYRAGASYLGYFMFVSIPLLPIFATTEMTPEVTALAWWLILALAPVTVFIAVTMVPETVAPKPPAEPVRLKGILASIAVNRPFQIVAAIYLLTQIATGMVAGLYFFFIDTYLGILEKFAHIGIIVAAISFCVTPAWPALINRFEKHKTLSVCTLATALTLFAMGFIRPGASAFPMLAIIFSASAMFTAGSQICLNAIIADVVDYDELKTGTNKAGNFYAFSALFQKLGLAFGGGTAFILAGLFGFNPVGVNDELAFIGFFLTFLAVPIMFNLVAVYFAWQFPLNRKRHGLIQNRLRKRRQAKNDRET